jgi:hypothetical protein
MIPLDLLFWAMLPPLIVIFVICLGYIAMINAGESAWEQPNVSITTSSTNPKTPHLKEVLDLPQPSKQGPNSNALNKNSKPQDTKAKTRLNDISSTVTALLPFLNTTAADDQALFGITHDMSTSLSKAVDAQNQTQSKLTKADERLTRLAKHVTFLEQSMKDVKQKRTNLKKQGDKEASRLMST